LAGGAAEVGGDLPGEKREEVDRSQAGSFGDSDSVIHESHAEAAVWRVSVSESYFYLSINVLLGFFFL
jgi:hypothetical protein